MKSLEPCGCRHWTQLPISIRPVSPPLPCHRRSITARTVCTALHIAILFINATNPRLRVSRVCAARRRAHAIFPPALAPWTSAQNILTGWPRWTSVNRPSSLGRETILSTAFRIPACAPLIFPRDFSVSFDGNIVSWLFFLLLFFFFDC